MPARMDAGDLARAVFRAIDRRDVEELTSYMSADVVFDFPLEPGTEGHHVGREDVGAWFRAFLGNEPVVEFSHRHVLVERPTATEGPNLVHVAWDLRLVDGEGKTRRYHGVTQLELADGTIVRMRDFIFEQLRSGAEGSGVAAEAATRRDAEAAVRS